MSLPSTTTIIQHSTLYDTSKFLTKIYKPVDNQMSQLIEAEIKNNTKIL
jgi:hypothetical protein